MSGRRAHESAASAASSSSSAAPRASSRSRQAPVLFSEEQAAIALSSAEERDVAEALALSLNPNWHLYEDESRAAAAMVEAAEEKDAEDEQEEEKEGGPTGPGMGGWYPVPAHPNPPLAHRHPLGSGSPTHHHENATELELLQLFLPTNVLEQIAAHTNASAPADWKRTNAAELYAFLGVHIFMGIDRLPYLRDYWSEMWGRPRVMDVFTVKRFEELQRYFSIVEPVDEGVSSRDAMARVRSFLAPLNGSFKRQWKPGAKLAIDESMVAFLGRADIKQFVPGKPHPEGYKIWCVANDKFLLHFEVYEGKAELDEEARRDGVTHALIMKLTKEYQRKGHTVYLDSAFTSPALVDSLLAVGIRCCGAVRSNRRDLPPKASISDADVRAMRPGSLIQRQKGETTFCVWKDQKVMRMLYNHLAADNMTTVPRYNEAGALVQIPCPAAIKDYFLTARSVDIVNQFHYSYPTGRKSKRCWTRLVWWVLDICIVNAFQLWRFDDRTARHLAFREQLMLQLMNQLPADQRPQRGSLLPPHVNSLAHIHYSVHAEVARDCKWCSNRLLERKETRFICAECKVHLCIGNCFASYHAHLRP
jgi:hypothetical protein